MCWFEGHSHFSSVVLCFPLVTNVAFIAFTIACVAHLRITKVSSGALFYITWSYISLEYVLDTFIQLSTPFCQSRHVCRNLYCNVSFQLSHLEICVTLLLF